MSQTARPPTFLRLMGNRGTATVELALVLPVLLLLVVGILDLARIFYADVSLTTAAWAAAYTGSSPSGSLPAPATCPEEGIFASIAGQVPKCQAIFLAAQKDLASLPARSSTNPTLKAEWVSEANSSPSWPVPTANLKVTIRYEFRPLFPIAGIKSIQFQRFVILHVRDGNNF